MDDRTGNVHVAGFTPTKRIQESLQGKLKTPSCALIKIVNDVVNYFLKGNPVSCHRRLQPYPLKILEIANSPVL